MRHELKIPDEASVGAIIGPRGAHVKQISSQFAVKCFVETSQRVLVICGHEQRVQHATEAAALLLKRASLRGIWTGVQRWTFMAVRDGSTSTWEFQELKDTVALPQETFRHELRKVETTGVVSEPVQDCIVWDLDDTRFPLLELTGDYIERVMAPSVARFCETSRWDSKQGTSTRVTALFGKKLFGANDIVPQHMYTWEELVSSYGVRGFASQWYLHCTDKSSRLLEQVWTRVFQEIATKCEPQITVSVSVITRPRDVMMDLVRNDHVLVSDGHGWRETIVHVPRVLTHDLLLDGSAGVRVRCGVTVQEPQAAHYQVHVESPSNNQWRDTKAHVVNFSPSLDVKVLGKRVCETWSGRWHGLDITLRLGVDGETQVECALPDDEQRGLSMDAVASALTEHVLALVASCEEVPCKPENEFEAATKDNDYSVMLMKDGESNQISEEAP